MSENSVPLNPMVNDHYPKKNGYNWEYTLFSDNPRSQDIPSFEWAGNATIPFSGARLRRTLFTSLNLRKINGRLTLIILCAVQERIEPQTWDALLAALAALWVSIVESSRLTLPIINLSRLPRWRIERSQRLLTRFSWT